MRFHPKWTVILLFMLLPVLLAACTPVPAARHTAHNRYHSYHPYNSHNPMAQWLPSPNFDERRPVLIVLHFTGDPSFEQGLQTLRSANSSGPVSAHYLIGRNGPIYQLVDDNQRAWHAGAGRWGTITDVNNASIGIELDNDGQSPFPQVQIDSLLGLLADLTSRLRIPRTQIIGHEDLAPGRKIDPGPLFPWQQLANAGFGLWPQGPLLDPPPNFDPWLALAVVGYPLDNRDAALRAFHHHFRGIDNNVMDTQDLRILYALVRQIVNANPSP